MLRQTQRDGELTLKTLPDGGGVASLTRVKVSNNQRKIVVIRNSHPLLRCTHEAAMQGFQNPFCNGTLSTQISSANVSKGAVSGANLMMYDGSVMTAIFFTVENAAIGA